MKELETKEIETHKQAFYPIEDQERYWLQKERMGLVACYSKSKEGRLVYNWMSAKHCKLIGRKKIGSSEFDIGEAKI